MKEQASLYTVVQKGFTLIELLVVIAIIGILSSIVLVALSSSRATAADSNVKGNLSTIRTAAELYASDHANSYGVFYSEGLPPPAGATSFCLNPTYTTGTLFSDPTIKNALTGAQNASGGVIRCFSDGDTWAVSVALKSNASFSWCVASNGNARQINTSNALNLAFSNSCLDY